MKDFEMEIKPLIAELSSVLDEEILNVELCLERLNELRGAVVRRKEDELEGLLETVRFQGDDYAKVASQRKEIFLKLSNVLNCPVEQINLGFIVKTVKPFDFGQIYEKKGVLKELMNKLSREYSATVMLLNEFSRLNSMLIKGIFKPAGEVSVYNHKGKSRLSNTSGLLSCRF